MDVPKKHTKKKILLYRHLNTRIRIIYDLMLKGNNYFPNKWGKFMNF